MQSIWLPALAWERRQRRPRCAGECGGPLVHCVRAKPAVHTRSGGARESHDEVDRLDQSASGTAFDACMSPGLRRLSVIASRCGGRPCAPLRTTAIVEEGENIHLPQVLQSRLNPAQAALGASPIAARLGPSPRGSTGYYPRHMHPQVTSMSISACPAPRGTQLEAARA